MLGEVFAFRFVGHLHIITCPFLVPLSKLEEGIGLASYDASLKGSSSPMTMQESSLHIDPRGAMRVAKQAHVICKCDVLSWQEQTGPSGSLRKWQKTALVARG